MRRLQLTSTASIWALGISLLASQAFAQPVKTNPERDAYYGDLHLHTTYSFDAYVLMGTKVDPDEAYRFAKGEPVNYLGQQVQRREPLDFLAVTDHSENIGVAKETENSDSPLLQTEWGKTLKKDIQSGNESPADRLKNGFAMLQKYFLTKGRPGGPEARKVSDSAWQREMDIANKNYEPGKFTTLIAYEYTAMTNGANLHRNVFFRGNTAPSPFSSQDSQNPEDLWKWLSKIRAQGYEALAIPHNGNASNGLMYDWTTLDGRPIDRAYAELRAENEPLTEIAQNKGSSDTHPILSPNDEFANFEIMDTLLVSTQPSKPQGSYVRDSLSRGLIFERKLGVNPYKFGIEGSSDLHGGLSVSSQEDYAGNIGGANLGGGKPSKEQAAGILGETGDKGAAAGISMLRTTSGNLTGVWAESNTRESIYDALRRKETFATSGTKLKFRFFGGWNYRHGLLSGDDWVKTAYADGAPMGGDLPSKPSSAIAPTFAIWAVKDPNSANLDRVQVIKVWEDKGSQKEKIYDVAWSGHRRIDPRTGKVSAVGNTVDLKTGKYTDDIGAAELKAMWTDPDFKRNHLAAYYLRVLEIPTPRWSTLLAIQSGLPLPKGVALTEQQRGWSSPIWYTPSDVKAAENEEQSATKSASLR